MALANAHGDRPSATKEGPAPPAAMTITTLFISNLHCPTCVSRIEETLSVLQPIPIESVSISIVSHSVTVRHSTDLPVKSLVSALEDEGFEIHSVFEADKPAEEVENLSLKDQHGSEWADNFDAAIHRWRQSWRVSQPTKPSIPQTSSLKDPGQGQSAGEEGSDMGKKRLHAANCAYCKAELDGLDGQRGDALPLTRIAPSTSLDDSKSLSSTDVQEEKSADTLRVEYQNGKHQAIEVVTSGSSPESKQFQAELAITGMTCSSCVSSITRVVQELGFVRSVNVSLLTNSAVVVFDGKQHAEQIVSAIEDAGFDVSIGSLEEIRSKGKATSQKDADVWKASYAIGGMTCSACVGNITTALERHPWIESIDVNLVSNGATILFHDKDHVNAITETIEDCGYDATLDTVVSVSQVNEANATREAQIRIEGMYCRHCPMRVVDALHQAYGEDVEIENETSMSNPILKIRYTARSPTFTIRQILSTIKATDNAFVTSVYHPPTIEDRSRELHHRERRRILVRLALAVAAAIPAFVIGIVCMQLLAANNSIRRYMMTPVWAGDVSRSMWALFLLATPVYLFSADTFHRKALKEIKTMWRPGSPTPLLQRFTRFGSMNMLMSLGTTIAYVSSVAELGIAATQKPALMPMSGTNADVGQGQAQSASSTYFDSVIFLTMFLLMGRFIEAYSKAKTGDAVTSLGKLRPTEAILVEEKDGASRKVSVDLLEVGDIVLVHHGSSPPFDGVIVNGETKFDESSLTGESRLVSKGGGDKVFSGTVNRAGPVSVQLTSVSGTSMLDQIIKIVREGQTKRAPVERAADVITSHFVPFVVAIGVTTWCVWLGLGLSHALPESWLEGQTGGWPLWSLRFAIAVFVVACPCGIGLAAPTALFVGGGLAATNGILVKGGGDAFQEASTLDCIVFDKTGTLTAGGEPSVTDYRRITDDDEQEVLGMTKRLEENSGHPIAKALVNFCDGKTDQSVAPAEMHEVPGKGLFGRFKLDRSTESALDVEIIVGNEALMSDYNVIVGPGPQKTLQPWKQQGCSVVLVAIRASDPAANAKESIWTLSSIFAISDALRPEAKGTITALRKRGIEVWMLSGDNSTTAQAVGQQVGIPKENIIAGVLPDQKADKIQWLQKTLPARKRKRRATVAMVGDGINDSPALTMADVGIAIGSGSDIAISSASFILISSDLKALLTLIDLSRLVFRRVWFNFGWALVYNCIAMPVAAGVFYPISSGGTHVKLDPVWASLAMASSSVSVICSSLLLRSGIPGVGFRPKRMVE
jgi:P-type Cu+ transporter